MSGVGMRFGVSSLERSNPPPSTEFYTRMVNVRVLGLEATQIDDAIHEHPGGYYAASCRFAAPAEKAPLCTC